MPHKRTDIDQDYIALRYLSGCQYKVLQYLVSRADHRGICYPSAETIGEGTGFSERNVYRAMEYLNDTDVIRYVRRDEYDIVTKRKMPNAYQVNPDYISLAPKFVPEARAMWDTLIERCGNRSSGLWCHINQQPIPLTNTSRSSSRETNTNNQFPLPQNEEKQEQNTNTPYPEGEDPISRAQRDGKAETHHDTGVTMSNQQRRAQSPSKSSVPPASEKYHNPEPINVNLPDQNHEILAFKIRGFGISMVQARGFVVTYGVERCQAAVTSIEATKGVKSPAGLFRSIVQNGLADDVAAARQKIFSDRR
jgi:hypothetical protein